MSDEEKSPIAKKIETYCGLLLAVFAAILAITDLGGGKYGDDEMIAVNEATRAYNWYQSKSIKETVNEGNRDMINFLLASGAISADKISALEGDTAMLNKKIKKYKLEKEEIKRGSANIKKENWIQEDNDGKLGNVMGADEWEALASKLGDAGDYFDRATLFLQLCLVLGAISIISPSDKSKNNFFYGMIIFGIIGTGVTCYAFYLANL